MARRRQQRGEDTIARVLEAALAVHAKAGHEGFTVHAIAAASGVSLGSLYHHFGSIDGLAAALYCRCMAELLDGLIAALDGVRTPRKGIAAIVRGYLAFTAARPAAARFLHASSYASFLPAHAATIVATTAPRVERILAWYRPHAGAGRLVALSDALVEVLVIGPVAELARRWLAGTPVDLEEAGRVLPERIWRSLRRAPARLA